MSLKRLVTAAVALALSTVVSGCGIGLGTAGGYTASGTLAGPVAGLDQGVAAHAADHLRRAGLFAVQQRRQPCIGQIRIRTAQQVLDKDALAPGHEGGGNG